MQEQNDCGRCHALPRYAMTECVPHLHMSSFFPENPYFTIRVSTHRVDDHRMESVIRDIDLEVFKVVSSSEWRNKESRDKLPVA